MNDPDARSSSLNPHDVLAQAAALAKHLQASGVGFLPAVAPESVTRWESKFAVTEPSQVLESSTSDATVPESIGPATPSTAIKSVVAPPNASTVRSPRSASRPPGPIVADEIQASYDGPPLSEADRASRLQILSDQVAGCVRCEKLSSCRKNTVFGEGNPEPRVAFFGEGPGADEDRTGRPFVGKAGQLLTKMIEACSFQREDVYILNSVKCRPPGNRNPEPEELNHCREYFEQQFQILRPEYIVCLGAVSSQTLLNSKLSVGRLRGKFHRYFESKVLVTYHPAYLLRNPAAKKAAWQDLQLMLRDAGITP